MVFEMIFNGNKTVIELEDTARAYSMALDIFSTNEDAVILETTMQVDKGYRVRVMTKRRRLILLLKTI